MPSDKKSSKQSKSAPRDTAFVDNMRDGRRDRAATFTDRKKQASRDACRKRSTTDD